MQQTFIFDFDGTIADSYGVVVAMLNTFADEHGLQKIESVSRGDLPYKNIPEWMDTLAIPRKPRAALAKWVKTNLQERLLAEGKPFGNLVDYLDILRSSQFQLGVFSGNSQATIEQFLSIHGITSFSFIDAGHHWFGKAAGLYKCLRRHHLEKENVLYIGDEVRDVQVAKAVGVDSVAVTWGFNSTTALQKEAPTYLIHTPGELLTIASQL